MNILLKVFQIMDFIIKRVFLTSSPFGLLFGGFFVLGLIMLAINLLRGRDVY